MAELTKEQKNTIRMIEKEAADAGVDPDFAVSLADLESSFKHVPSNDKSSTAFGPFQVNRATAKANGVDYDEMVKDPSLAVRAGVLNIARHAKNPDLMTTNPDTGEKEIDPSRIAAAHRLGEGSDYARTGDRKYITPELNKYLLGVADHFENGEFPNSVMAHKEGEKPAGEQSIDMGSVPLAEYKPSEEDKANREDMATWGAMGGAGVGAVKAPVFEAGHRIYDMIKNVKNGNVTPQDIADITEATMKATSQPETGTTPGGKWGIKTGYGVGEGSVEDVSGRYKRRAGQGKITSRMSKMYGVPKEGESADLTQRMIDRSNEAQLMAEAEQRHAEEKIWADKLNNARKIHSNARLNLTPELSSDYRAGKFISDNAERAGNLARGVLNSSPVRWGLGGMGALYNAENASQQFNQGNPLGYLAGLTSAGGALASGLSLVPKIASKANPAAIGLTAGSQALSDINRGDYDSAKADAYLGGLGLASLPVAIGALVPSSLNRGEQQELNRRSNMPATISNNANFLPSAGDSWDNQ